MNNYCNTGMFAEKYTKLLSSKIKDGQTLESFDRYLSELVDTINGLAHNILGSPVADNIKELVFINGIPEFISKQVKLGNHNGYSNCYNRAKEVAIALSWNPKKGSNKNQRNNNNNWLCRYPRPRFVLTDQ